ncbi:MAG TPA: hypothetical protein VM491_05275, partial [Burkholderiaceae bacterium]|nr:hypothetical protein [Burkholderiaceae bacterium]
MALYAVTIALSAFLLFLIQPVIAKQILPWFGGSAAVWTTCVAFFQLVLLAGYAYADVTARRLSPRRLALLHSALLAASLATLPAIPSDAFKPGDPELPIGRILLLLTATIGLPYLMLSTTAPLVQAWFARSFRGARVYRLYALSNVASMLALLSYPALLEPLASARAQALGWSVLYAVFALLCIGSAWYAVRTGGDALPLQAAAAADPPPSRADQLLWLLLAALGSTMLLGVTTHITQNIASIPFLWVLPLAIYLVTFILCFDGKGWYLRTQYVLLSAVLGVAMMAGLSYRFDFDDARLLRGILHIDYAIPLYSFGLFVVCMFCHGELVERKPAPAYLTRFYLMVAAGGAIGGTLVAGIAPLVFAAYWEFPAAVTVAMLLTFLLGEARLRALGAVATLACAALPV